MKYRATISYWDFDNGAKKYQTQTKLMSAREFDGFIQKFFKSGEYSLDKVEKIQTKQVFH